MEFQTKIIVKKKNPRARVAIVGVVILIGSGILAVTRHYDQAAMWTFGIGMAVLVGGAIYAKGDLTHIRLSDIDLVVSISEIKIGEAVYSVSLVDKLEFNVEGYDGMILRETNRGNAIRSNGLDNYLSFVYAGEEVDCRFYMPDAGHVQQLGGVFKEFYSKRIEFVETVEGSRSFLFEPVTHRELEDSMIENGYR